MYIWLDRALEYFSYLPRNEPKLQLWHDFLLWSASQVCEPLNRDLQIRIIARYGGDIRTLFMGAYRAITAGVAEDPAQNVLLHLAVEFGVACPSPAQYAGETIDQLFVQRVMDLTDKSDPDVALAAADGITIHLANCDKDYGSSMIAMANGCPGTGSGTTTRKRQFLSVAAMVTSTAIWRHLSSWPLWECPAMLLRMGRSSAETSRRCLLRNRRSALQSFFPHIGQRCAEPSCGG